MYVLFGISMLCLMRIFLVVVRVWLWLLCFFISSGVMLWYSVILCWLMICVVRLKMGIWMW